MDEYECNREIVGKSYDIEVARNRKKFLSGDVKTSCEYIFPNQKEDASNIIQTFYTTDVRVISIVKRTKVGMDGLMIEIAMRISTHINDEFMVFCDNVFFVTGMSNISWENDMKEKTPSCFKDNIHHHGKLHLLKTKLKNVKNALIIIDEIDTGDKENQKLHSLLEICDILDMMYMEENNIRFIFVSATMVNELKELCKWGDKHTTYSMTIPKEYIGHKDFLEKGLIQEFYKVDTPETAEKWIQNDILQHYGDDYRVHIIRTDKESANYINVVCNNNNIAFKNHTSVDRISDDDLKEIFGNITKHVVIAVKGFYRRANLIPNAWKMKIGATHERFVAKYDTNVQVQGLPGRMSGYWRTAIENGHKTGPHRTSINAIKEYEAFYENPLGNSIYNCAIKPVFLNPNNIRNLDYNTELQFIPKKETKEKKEKKEKQEKIVNKCMRAPVIINIKEAEIISLSKLSKSNKKQFIFDIVNNTDEKLYKYITNTDCVQITMPIAEGSYKKHITDIVKKNKPCTIDLTPEDKEKNNWQLFIDNRENRLCFVIWVVDELLY